MDLDTSYSAVMVVLFFSLLSLVLGFIIGYWWASRDLNP